jgi:hypothetical protein
MKRRGAASTRMKSHDAAGSMRGGRVIPKNAAYATIPKTRTATNQI